MVGLKQSSIGARQAIFPGGDRQLRSCTRLEEWATSRRQPGLKDAIRADEVRALPGGPKEKGHSTTRNIEAWSIRKSPTRMTGFKLARSQVIAGTHVSAARHHDRLNIDGPDQDRSGSQGKRSGQWRVVQTASSWLVTHECQAGAGCIRSMGRHEGQQTRRAKCRCG